LHDALGEGVKDDFSLPSMFVITLSNAQTQSFQTELGIEPESNLQIFKF
jgi:hypothetical protein